jgi:group I intron endonuclease
MGVIYILENKTNSKCYIGQTIKSFKHRINQHQHSNTYIGKALRKYGIDNFKQILIEDIPEEKLDELEREYIQKYNSLSPNGYNLETGGNRLKHLSEETKKKCGEKNIGRHLTKEVLKKLSERMKGNTFNLGKMLTTDHKEKIGKSNKGKHNIKHTENSKKLMSELKKGQKCHLGFKNSEESKLKMSKSHKGKFHSQETKKKMSETQKVIWQKRKIKNGDKFQVA